MNLAIFTIEVGFEFISEISCRKIKKYLLNLGQCNRINGSYRRIISEYKSELTIPAFKEKFQSCLDQVSSQHDIKWHLIFYGNQLISSSNSSYGRLLSDKFTFQDLNSYYQSLQDRKILYLEEDKRDFINESIQHTEDTIFSLDAVRMSHLIHNNEVFEVHHFFISRENKSRLYRYIIEYLVAPSINSCLLYSSEDKNELWAALIFHLKKEHPQVPLIIQSWIKAIKSKIDNILFTHSLDLLMPRTDPCQIPYLPDAGNFNQLMNRISRSYLELVKRVGVTELHDEIGSLLYLDVGTRLLRKHPNLAFLLSACYVENITSHSLADTIAEVSYVSGKLNIHSAILLLLKDLDYVLIIENKFKLITKSFFLKSSYLKNDPMQIRKYCSRILHCLELIDIPLQEICHLAYTSISHDFPLDPDTFTTIYNYLKSKIVAKYDQRERELALTKNKRIYEDIFGVKEFDNSYRLQLFFEKARRDPLYLSYIQLKYRLQRLLKGTNKNLLSDNRIDSTIFNVDFIPFGQERMILQEEPLNIVMIEEYLKNNLIMHDDSEVKQYRQAFIISLLKKLDRIITQL